MSKFWHILATIGIAALGSTIPLIQHAVVAHPLITTILGTAWTVLGNILQSPVKQPTGN